MYQLVEDVYPYLIAFFILDSLIWVRTHQVLFVAWWGASALRRGPGLYGYGLLPTAGVVVVAELPLLLDADALHWRRAERGSRRRVADGGDEAWLSVPYASLRKVTAQGRLLTLAAERRIELDCRSPALAAHVATQIDALRLAPAGRRAALLDQLERAASDVEALRAQQAQLGPRVRSVRTLACLLAALVLLALPAALYVPGHAWRPAVAWLVPAIVLVHAAVVFHSVRLLRQCGLRTNAILETLAPLLLFPPGSIHALSVILRERYVRFSAAACAAAWLDPATLVSLARRERQRWERSCVRPGDERQVAFARQQAARWRWALAAAHVDLERCPAPRRSDPTAAAYCPLCLVEYRAGFPQCSDCLEPLAAYEPSPPA